ncbi:MAG TPA: endonuclease/exonuclease/phosphatase family protein [Xanthomonadales bacterium]|nr:endonuclease/exonuclease/phosphatase family protein [Xanthomonadales bacterium]
MSRHSLSGWFALLLALLPITAIGAETWPRAAGSDFRAMVWNVSRESFFERRQAYVAALRAIDADLMIFDEMPGTRSAAEVAAVLREIDPAHPYAWQVAYGSSGFNQRVVFALRGPLEPLRQFDYLPYPPRLIARLRKVPTNPQQRQWLDANLAAGIGAYAVEARLGGRRIIAVGVDLQCCGDSDDAWEEDRRHVEARAIRTLLDRVWSTRSPDAVIVAGDFNAVRGLRPLRLLQGVRKAPDLRLAIVDAKHANGVDTWTWDGRGTPFPSRAIDYMLHSPALSVRQSVIFDAETLSASDRQRLGLEKDAFKPLSEHRPVVVDFAWR